MEEIKSERQKMIDGELYFAGDPELTTARKFAREQMKLINKEEDGQIRRQLVEETFGTTGTGSYIEPSISFDYGFNIHVGKNFYANFNSIFQIYAQSRLAITACLVHNAQLYAATHPLHPVKRNSGLEYGKPITIGDNVWLGGGVIITPGVTLGNNVVVAAGSVVTKSFPDNCVIGGNPAKLIKEIELEEKRAPLTIEREKIDVLDKKIVALLEERMNVVEAIVDIKKTADKEILDTTREQDVLNKIDTYIQNDTYKEVIKETYQGIMDASKHFQQKKMD